MSRPQQASRPQDADPRRLSPLFLELLRARLVSLAPLHTRIQYSGQVLLLSGGTMLNLNAAGIRRYGWKA